MKRILSTTALMIAMSGGAVFAQTNANGFGTVAVEQGDFLATDLIGMRIYNSEVEMENGAVIADGAEQEWDDIGEINDIIVSKDGKVTAVILGVGGFLGMGERDVSISMDAIRVLREDGDSDDRFLVVNTTKEMLEQAPEFDRDMHDGMDDNAAVMDNNTAVVKNEEPAEATAPAATDTDTAMEREMLARPAVTRDGYADAPMEVITALTAEDIQGTTVYGANDENVGEIDSLIMSDDGKVDRVVINVGGFLGLGEKPVAVTYDELQILQEADGDDLRIYIDSSKEALEAQPEYQD